MENNLIEQLKIAELDSSKTYFLHISTGHLAAEAFQHVYKHLSEKFDEYGIKNIMLFTPPEVECKFIEVDNGK